MQREDIKSYKDACKCISRKPRKYKDDHMNTYEQLTTIIAALNFIANGNKPWKHELHKNTEYYYVWRYSGSNAGSFNLGCTYSVDPSYSAVGAYLRIKEYSDALYLKNNFTELLSDWFKI